MGALALHSLRSDSREENRELAGFFAIHFQERTHDFSALQTAWRRGRDSNPAPSNGFRNL